MLFMATRAHAHRAMNRRGGQWDFGKILRSWFSCGRLHQRPRHPEVGVVADEYFSSWRLSSIKDLPGHINIAPHRIVWETETKALEWTDKVIFHDLTSHALTMSEFIKTDEKLKKWVEAPLDATILHVGLLDILNVGVSLPNPKTDFPKLVMFMLGYMIETKKLYLDNEEGFRKWRKSHRFIVYGLPDVTGFSNKKLSEEEYVTLRRKANKGLRLKALNIFDTYRAFIARPKIEHPTFYGMHLSRHHQEVLNRTITLALAKLFCNRCKITSYNRNKLENFLEPPGAGESHHQPELVDNFWPQEIQELGKKKGLLLFNVKKKRLSFCSTVTDFLYSYPLRSTRRGITRRKLRQNLSFYLLKSFKKNI